MSRKNNPIRALSTHLTYLSILIGLSNYPAWADEIQDQVAVRLECSNEGSQAAMYDCLIKKADKSAAELKKIENKMRKAFSKWDEDAKYVNQAKSKFEASVKSFKQYRKKHCEFIASLVGGAAGASRESMRFACEFELNTRRTAQIQSALSHIANIITHTQ